MINMLLRNKLILIIAAFLVAGGVWYGLSGTPTEPTLVTSAPIGTVSTVDQGIVTTLLALRVVKLDGTIFSDPSFMSLKDFSTQIVPEPVGRENPFAPLSFGSIVIVPGTQGGKIFKPKP